MRDLRERMFLAYNTRAYPANKQILLDLLATRQEIAIVLGFRSWADLATADQMMGSAANVRTFLAKLEESSREGAHARARAGAGVCAQRQAGIKAIDITSRGYWYEQFRRSAFDFDSQSVRPYFPYAQVEAGVLDTAARLFKIEFRPSSAPAWDPAVSCLRSRMKSGIQVGPLLSRHASARRQGQVVFRCAGGNRRARALYARGCADLQFSRRRYPDDPGLSAIQPTW